jgi:hypothetical protein
MFKNIFKKPEYLVLLVSLGFTTLISIAVGVGGFLITGKFLGFFIIAFVLQFIIFGVANTYFQHKDLIEGAKLMNEQLEVTSKYFINLTCSYCQVSNAVPIILNQENRFKCESCSQVNGVKMQFFSTQITTPLKKITMPLDEDNEQIS